MESILGLSARYVPPATARAKLKHVTEDREKLDERYKHQIEVRFEKYKIFTSQSKNTFALLIIIIILIKNKKYIYISYKLLDDRTNEICITYYNY